MAFSWRLQSGRKKNSRETPAFFWTLTFFCRMYPNMGSSFISRSLRCFSKSSSPSYLARGLAASLTISSSLFLRSSTCRTLNTTFIKEPCTKSNNSYARTRVLEHADCTSPRQGRWHNPAEAGYLAQNRACKQIVFHVIQFATGLVRQFDSSFFLAQFWHKWRISRLGMHFFLPHNGEKISK